MSANATPGGLAFDLSQAADRVDFVAEVRRMVSDHFKGDWLRRCPDVAGFALYALRLQGVNSYRIACGRVVETSLATAKTGKPPLVRYEGFIDPEGKKSEYHVWLVDDRTGHKIDCSELPVERYGHGQLWEPYEPVAELEYVERPDVTASMGQRILKKYNLGDRPQE